MKNNKKTEFINEWKEILEAIERIKLELATTRMKFDMADDDALIDSYIYEISALNSKYQYFLKKAKAEGLVAEGFDDITA